MAVSVSVEMVVTGTTEVPLTEKIVEMPAEGDGVVVKEPERGPSLPLKVEDGGIRVSPPVVVALAVSKTELTTL